MVEVQSPEARPGLKAALRIQESPSESLPLFSQGWARHFLNRLIRFFCFDFKHSVLLPGLFHTSRKERGMTRAWLRVLPIPGLLLCLIACSSLAGIRAKREIPPRLVVGHKIPDLAFLDSQGKGIRLYPLLQNASKTVLVFYQGYWSSGCQRQFADLRERFSDFRKQGAQIIGVSVDNPWRAQEFGRKIEKEHLVGAAEGQPIELPFLLFSDSSRVVIRKLGIAEKQESGSGGHGEGPPGSSVQDWVARPTTVLLDMEGTIRWVYIGKSAEDRPSADLILQVLAAWS
jgi:peroxiredoxin